MNVHLIIGDKISPVWRLHVVILTDAEKKKKKKELHKSIERIRSNNKVKKKKVKGSFDSIIFVILDKNVDPYLK